MLSECLHLAMPTLKILERRRSFNVRAIGYGYYITLVGHLRCEGGVFVYLTLCLDMLRHVNEIIIHVLRHVYIAPSSLARTVTFKYRDVIQIEMTSEHALEQDLSLLETRGGVWIRGL